MIWRGDLPRSVFVPWQKTAEGTWVKRDDLPRFLTSREVIDYLGAHPELRNQHLQWAEEVDEKFIYEYLRGVGGDRGAVH